MVMVSKHEMKVTIGAKVPLMIIVAELAGFPVVQVILDVSTQVTASLFTGIYEYVALLVPTLIPLTFHW